MARFLDLVGLVALWSKIKNYVIGKVPIDYKIDYNKRYFTIISLEDNNTIGWKASNANLLKTISISIDLGKTWAEKTSSTSGTILTTLNTGDTLLVKGSNTAYGTSSRYNYFTSTGNFDIEGNIMSLMYGDNFIGQATLNSSGYNLRYLFFQCTKLISAKNLILPATTLANNCYESMFSNCTALTIAPELPATTLAERCYSSMFNYCTSLTVAPALPATILVNNCYNGMFQNCTLLNYIKCLATNMSPLVYTNSWVYNVAASGTFISNPGVTWPTSTSGIPSSWNKYYDIFSGNYNDLSHKPDLSLYRIPIIDLTSNNDSN